MPISAARALGVERQRARRSRASARASKPLDRRLVERRETPARARATASAALSSNEGFSVVAPISVIDAVLHDGEERILLGAVEAVDFVDEQQRAAALGAARARRLEHLFQLGDAGVDRRDLDELGVRLLRRSAARRSSCRCPAAPRRSSSPANRAASSRVSAPSGPVRCGCPATSASAFGRSRSASGVIRRPAPGA